MQSSTFLMAILVVALLMLFTTPATEATFFLIACMLRSPLCPWITTTPAAAAS
ncbi:uncharacterized protein LOC113564121 [Drosophila erecta]|uniref:GG17064 n=1 Tax=Drosophila erecta TaxID=7220 RepID=B3P159_DROER|nr:uncharacterized protein LOC6552752 [Drosophila erecta]XP_026835067.1 uncharacterized protein LOC113564121 [Drosophila erecta]EDV49248.1 uncharacterized protein Dere_GG17064 [Drosophila erecta]